MSTLSSIVSKSVFFIFLLFFSVLLFIGCQKKGVGEQNEIFSVSQQKIHTAKVETWLKMIPLEGKFSNIDISKVKTVFSNGVVTTRIQIGEKGNAFYFISNKDKFHVYGINASKLKLESTYTGMVEIYDFQTLSKKGVRYNNGVVSGLLAYKNSQPIINAYKNYYPVSSYKMGADTSSTIPVAIIQSSSQIFSSTAGTEKALSVFNFSNTILAIRKFFCELFGGSWILAPHALDTPTQYCAPGGADEVQELPPPEAAGNPDYGIIWQNLNNPAYFDVTSNFWANILAGLNAGNVNLNLAVNGTGSIDPAFINPDEIRSLYYILNTQYNQQPSSPFDGTVDELISQFKSNYNNNPAPPIPIIALLLKIGANAAADLLSQALFVYLTEENCSSFFSAIGHDNISWGQVARSGGEGIFFWRTPGGKLGRAATTSVVDILANITKGKYGMSDYETMGTDFMFGFFSDLAGGEMGELASKYAITKIGKGILNKFHIPYSTATKWLGGGLENISHTLNTSHGSISSIKKMVGWSPSKICVVGRNMSDRVIPYAQVAGAEFFDETNPIAAQYITQAVKNEWNSLTTNGAIQLSINETKNTLLYKANERFIKDLKNQGYTFIDLGYAGFGVNTSAFYEIELKEIFN